MATSGSVNYTQTRNEIILDALQLIGVYGIGRTVSAEDMTFSANMLNKMIKAWQGKGIHLWSKEEAVLFVADNTGSYTLSNASSSARATKWDDAVITQLNGSHAASATSLTVDSTSGMAASDIIGVVLDSDAVTWSTIASVDSSTTLTIDDGLDSVAGDNKNVYTFTNRINKPLRIHSMRRRDGVTSGDNPATEIPMVALSHQDFFNLPNQDSNGVPTHYYYNPDLSDGKVYLWPRPSNPKYYFRFTYERMLEDFDAASDNPDFPTEWLECITYQLAARLADGFGKSQSAQPIIQKAGIMLQDMLNWDAEVESLYLQPDMRYN